MGITEEPCWKFDPASGSFKMNAAGEILADTTSDLKWKLGMDRRGLALDQASILSHAVHTRWISTLIQHKHRKPPTSDYRSVSWQQLHTADAELFMIAAQCARAGIRPDSRGEKPLDALFTSLMTDARITFFLMPMPKGTGAASSSAADSPAVANVPAQQQQQRGSKRELPKQHQQQQQQQQQPKKKDKKGKGKGKNDKKRRPTIAQDGSMTHTRSGKPLCTDFNGGGCRAGAMLAGLNECTKGLHLCNAPTCNSRASHGRADHSAANE